MKNIPAPSVLEKILFGFWLQASSGNSHYCDGKSAEELNNALKSAGFHAYEDGDGYPQLSHWYNGPFEPGMTFVWEPLKRNATEFIVITRVVKIEGDEDRIWSRKLTGNDPQEWGNDESRMREACIRIEPPKL